MSTKVEAPDVILCVDDCESTLDFLQRYLSKPGYLVLTAGGGLEALAVLRATPVDILVLDYQMPGMSGSALARQVRLLHPTIPIVLFSGSMVEESDVKLVDAFIPKGGSPSILLNTLEGLLRCGGDSSAAVL